MPSRSPGTRLQPFELWWATSCAIVQYIAVIEPLLKGVLHAADARQASALGVAGLIVSNHGARVLDTAVSTAWALAHCDGRGDRSHSESVCFETANDLVSSTTPLRITFKVFSGGFFGGEGGGNLSVGKFALLYTTDSRDLFADGRATDGQMGEHWTIMTPDTVAGRWADARKEIVAVLESPWTSGESFATAAIVLEHFRDPRTQTMRNKAASIDPHAMRGIAWLTAH